MAFISGLLGHKSQKTAPTIASGLQLQSSTYGQPVPLVYGVTRIAPNLLWYGDFVAIPQPASSGGKGGVGGGGGGKGGGGTTQYQYQVACQLGLCEGPIGGVGNVYIDKNVYTLADVGLSLSTGTYPQSPWGYLVTNHSAVSGEAQTIPSSGPYTVTVTYASGFVADAGVTGATVSIQMTLIRGVPGANQFSVNNNVITFNAANAGQKVVVSWVDIYGQSQGGSGYIPNTAPYTVYMKTGVNTNNVKVTATASGFTPVSSSPAVNQYSVNVATGTYTFNSANAGAAINISYISTTQPDQNAAIGYNGIAHVDAVAYQLGNSPQLPNHNFELEGIYANALLSSTIPDADPSLVIADLLTNVHYGAGFPSTRVGSFSVYQAYCIALGLWVSPSYVQQASASSMLDDLATATNSAFVWSEGVLDLVPYGDQSITNNGYTYTAPSSPLYSLTDDDFERNANGTASSSASMNDDPVLLVRKRPADQINSVKLECLDRTNQYNAAIIESKDQASIDTFGLRQAPTKESHLFCDLNAGQLSAQLQLQRQAIRNVYSFQLDQRYAVLDPMDIIAITDSGLGLNNQWVRITEITENDDYTLSITAEEYLSGTGNAPIYGFQSSVGFSADYNMSAGSPNTPIIFTAPIEIATTGLEVWVAVSGGENWGGCDVWASTDGNSYTNLGRITGPARQGVLTASLASNTDPDTVDTLSVDLSESNGLLFTVSQADADALHTLCYADGELISYETATLTAANAYNLTYLRRGCYNTPISGHSSGTQFARLDNGVFTIPFSKNQIGTQLYIKLTSFNIYGGAAQSLSDATAYSTTIGYPPAPVAVTGFSVAQQGNVVVFNWVDLQPNDSGLKGYDIGYAPQGTTDWTNFTLLTEAHRGTEMTNAAVPPGTWVFALRAHDVVDQLGPMTTFNLTVTNNNDVIFSDQQAPAWLGTNVNAVVHYTGVLVPQSQNAYPQSTYSTISPPGAPILNTVAGGSFPATDYYVKLTWLTGNNGTSPTAETTAGTEQNITVFVSGQLLTVAPPASIPSNAASYNVYVSTTATMETLQNSSPIPVNETWTMPASGLLNGISPPAINHTGWEVFDIFVPWPAYTSVTTASHDLGFEGSVRPWMAYTPLFGPGEMGTPGGLQTDLFVDSVNQGPWEIGVITGRYFQGELIYDPANEIDPGNVVYFDQFSLTVDNSPTVENAGSVTIAPGGTAITFPTPYHLTPNVVCTVTGSSALYATAASISTTGFTAHVWNASGSDVGGVISWQSTGE